MGIKIITTNRKASHEYALFEKFEAGIALQGTEVKALRLGKANLSDGWVDLSTGEAILRDAQISPYTHGNLHNHTEKRPRRLLLKRNEIHKLNRQVAEKGMSVIPLKLYFKDSLVKIEIAVAKGKKHYDKRDSEKTRQANRDIARAMRSR